MQIEQWPIFIDIKKETLDINQAINRVRSDTSGAIVTFTGCTRIDFDGKTVTHLHYESFLERAILTIKNIANNNLKTWGLHAVSIEHRIGEVRVGEDSIIIAVSAEHRKEAFHGAEQILEDIKSQAEIWKREYYDDGLSTFKQNKDFRPSPSALP